MAQPIIYVEQSRVRDGKLGDLKAAMNELVRFIEANEPQLIAYNVYFTDDDTRVSVVHVHADSASLEFHMKTAGPLFPGFAPFIELLRIDVYGEPTEPLVEQLRQKARMLGSGSVAVHVLHAGFVRLSERVR